MTLRTEGTSLEDEVHEDTQGSSYEGGPFDHVRDQWSVTGEVQVQGTVTDGGRVDTPLGRKYGHNEKVSV